MSNARIGKIFEHEVSESLRRIQKAELDSFWFQKFKDFPSPHGGTPFDYIILYGQTGKYALELKATSKSWFNYGMLSEKQRNELEKFIEFGGKSYVGIKFIKQNRVFVIDYKKLKMIAKEKNKIPFETIADVGIEIHPYRWLNSETNRINIIKWRIFPFDRR